ncbi:MAG: hypothetical protein M0R37_05405 [Bacteroidales bacterium]|nr:hypothetical protein [Bacteroidales bacterium]
MRHLILLVFSLFSISLASGQKPIKDARNNFRNFGAKTTKVVLSDEGIIDAYIRDAVKKEWKISPYEFCTPQEYEQIKEDTTYFFLLRTDGIFNDEYQPSLEFLSLIKGGPEFKKGLFMSAEMISLPLQAKDDESGEIFPFLPSYLQIMQDYILKVQKNLMISLSGGSSLGNLTGINGKTLLFRAEDIAFKTEPDEIKWTFRGRAETVDQDAIEKAMIEFSDDVAVGLVISPKEGHKGGYCYKLVIDPAEGRLYFFKKKKVTSSSPAGFSRSDIKKISAPYRK